MQSKPVAILMAVIVLAAAGAAYYYGTHGADEGAVIGVVVEKVQRQAGTEAGDKPLAQGLRVLSGQSAQQEVFYVLRVKPAGGEIVEMVVSRELFQKVQQGDTVQRVSPDASPTIAKRASRQ